MNKFLLKYYSVLTHTLEILATVTGLIIFKRYKQTPAKYFILFLINIVFLEQVGSYVLHVRPNKSLYFFMGT